MPSANRFAYVRGVVREHPVIVASWAATAGILLGGFVTLKVLTPEPRAEKIGTAQAVVQPKAVSPRQPPETTGAAPSGGDVVASNADCERQTWPYLSQPCMDAMRAKNRGPRVISTDKLDKPTVTAIESGPTATPSDGRGNPAPAPAASAPTVSVPSAPVAAATPAAVALPAPVTAPASTAELTPPAASPAPAPAVFAAPERSPGALNASAQQQDKAVEPAEGKRAKPDVKQERVAKKAKRKPKLDPKAEQKAAPQEDDDDDRIATTGSASSDLMAEDRASDDRIPRGRTDQRRRAYNVPADDGSGDRRVVVIRRGGGGLFENLFGGAFRD